MRTIGSHTGVNYHGLILQIMILVIHQLGRYVVDAKTVSYRKFHIRMSTISDVSKPSDKTITFMRHGITEMNELMDPWGSRGFCDKMLYDTKLSSRGVQQCKELNRLIHLKPTHPTASAILNTDLIVVSPLRRTLQTAELVLRGILDQEPFKSIPKLACPFVAERLYLSSDIGRPKSVLEIDHPTWDFSMIEVDEPWWFVHKDPESYVEWRPSDADYCGILGEPKEDFKNRIDRFKVWLDSRKETRILVVAHWGTIHALTGAQFNNLQVQSFNRNELLEEPKIDH